MWLNLCFRGGGCVLPQYQIFIFLFLKLKLKTNNINTGNDVFDHFQFLIVCRNYTQTAMHNIINSWLT